MSSEKTTCKVFIVLAGVLCISGCIPEDTLKWSADGSLGLLKMDGALYLVDGTNGELTEIEKENVQTWPDIFEGGNLICYSRKVVCSSLSEALELLPAGQAKMIQYHAEQMREQIMLRGGLVNGEFPFPNKGLLVPHNYRNWVIRQVCEKGDSELSEVLGQEDINKGKGRPIECYEVVVLQNGLSNKSVIAVNLFRTMATRFGPKGKFIAYLMHTQRGEVDNSPEEEGLYVASLDDSVKAMFVDHPVSVGYCWRDDGQALAYLTADVKNLEDEFVPGTLKEKTVAGEDGALIGKATTVLESGTVETDRCTGEVRQLAATTFQPWMKVAYGPAGGIFFSNAALCLPSSLEDPEWSLFKYDPATRSVANVLPSIASDFVGANVNWFVLSPDRKKVLLPMENNRFGIYEFATVSGSVPVEENEGFSSDGIELPPAWKGNDEISCLVAENSHFLVAEGEERHRRKEVVIIGADGEKGWILSENWPDEIMGVSQQAQDPNKPAQ